MKTEKMYFKQIILITLVGTVVCDVTTRTTRQATTPSPDEPVEDEDNGVNERDACEKRGRAAMEAFPDPITRDKLRRILERSLELLNHQSRRIRESSCRQENIDLDAGNVLRFLTQDPNIGCTTEESSH